MSIFTFYPPGYCYGEMYLEVQGSYSISKNAAERPVWSARLK